MDLLLYFLMSLIRLLNLISHPIYILRNKGKKKVIPPIKNDLLKISATDLAHKIRTKVISSEEVCKAYIARIKEVNPYINAVVEERFKLALEEAKRVDDFLKGANLKEAELRELKPLLGVPLTVKESCSVEGMSLSVGSLSRRSLKAEADGELVSRLRLSGAIPLAVSNTPELCLSWETSNLITGSTSNPYDTTCTAAGSSGGEGALLGSGASLIGLGSDVAGSIRLPALFNGIFGHKPSPKIAPIKGHQPLCSDEYLVLGPMARYAKDLKTMLKVLVGDKAKELKLDEEVNIKNLRVYYMEDGGFAFGVPRVQTEIKKAIKESVSFLKSSGANIEQKKFPILGYANEICGHVLYHIKEIPDLIKGENSSTSSEFFKYLNGNSNLSLNVIYFYILQNLYKRNALEPYLVKNDAMKREIVERLGDDGVLIFPTWTSSANKHEQFYFLTGSLMYLVAANALGLPATHVPCGLDKKGLPIGVQIIAGPNQDRLCLAVAEELEKRFGGWVPPS